MLVIVERDRLVIQGHGEGEFSALRADMPGNTQVDGAEDSALYAQGMVQVPQVCIRCRVNRITIGR